MKNLLLYTFVLLAFIPGFSQSFDLFYQNQSIEYNTVLTLSAHPDSGQMILHELEVKNIAVDTIDVLCVRTIIDTVPNTTNSFCWGLCYPPTTDTSAIWVSLASGGIETGFEATHTPNGNEGLSRVKYSFYDKDNPDDHADVFVEFNATAALAVPDKKENNFSLSSVYPNPANTAANFDYTFSPNHKKAELSIFNLLGAKVKTYVLNENEGTLTVNTSDLNEGIYFYSLLINNETYLTHKLIIKH